MSFVPQLIVHPVAIDPVLQWAKNRVTRYLFAHSGEGNLNEILNKAPAHIKEKARLAFKVE